MIDVAEFRAALVDLGEIQVTAKQSIGMANILIRLNKLHDTLVKYENLQAERQNTQEARENAEKVWLDVMEGSK